MEENSLNIKLMVLSATATAKGGAVACYFGDRFVNICPNFTYKLNTFFID
jgi:hypothetical protein